MTQTMLNIDYREWLKQQPPFIDAHVITDINYGDEFPIKELLDRFSGNIITFEKTNVYFAVKPTCQVIWDKPTMTRNVINKLADPTESIYIWQRKGFQLRYKQEQLSAANMYAIRRDVLEGPQYSDMQKPESLVEWLFRLWTNPGDNVVDLCAGTGTMLVTGNKLGRNVTGCEKSPAMIGLYGLRLKDGAR